MKKRILSALLAVAMLIGMLPLSVFAEEEATETPSYVASYAGDIVIDGSSSETEWNHVGKLSNADGSETRPFDILWDAEGLYVSVIPEAGDASLVISAKGGSTTVDSNTNSDIAVWGEAVEAALNWNTTGIEVTDYGLTIPVSVWLDELSWEGNVTLISNERLQKPTAWSRTDSADDPNNATNLKTHFMADGGLQDILVAIYPAQMF